MTRKLPLAILLFAALAIPAIADDGPVCPCIPIHYKWIVTECETWNCAASAMVLANGESSVITMPTADSKFKWIVLKRVASEGVMIDPPPPFEIEQFETMDPAMSRFHALDKQKMPLLLTTSDGTCLVVYRNDVAGLDSRGRVAGH